MSVLDPEIEEKYEVLARMAEGGMGTVYKVRHRHLKTLRVIKTSKFGENESDRARFLAEAASGAELVHPNLARVFDFDITSHGTAYIVMEYVDGATLSYILSTSTLLPIPRIVEITLEVLEGLQYLHDRGFVHRDVSPDNVMIANKTQRVKLIDLGIAKSREHSQSLTAEGKFIGKVRYAAPEQFRGEADPHTDLYSLGMVMYELLTGTLPFRSLEMVAIVAAKLAGDLKTFDEIDPEGRVPQRLRAVVMRALEHEPVNRFESAKEFAGALRESQKPDKPAEKTTPIDLPTPQDRLKELEVAAEEIAWVAATRSNNVDGWRAYLSAYPDSPRIVEARQWLEALQRRELPPPAAPPSDGGSPPPPRKPEPPPPPPPPPPERIGRFKILGRVATGKTGHLYKAFDPVRDKVVGIKVPANESTVDHERMLRSARQWLDICHEHIVPVFDINLGGAEHGLWIVTKFIDGLRLDDFAMQTPLNVDQCVAITIQVSRALQFLHERGWMHREVTPANILIEHETGRAMLLDSGIARPVETDDSLTRTGSYVGDLAYMAPEQLNGHAGQRSDVFSLAKVLYFLLTLKDPAGDLRETISVSVVIPEPLRSILIKALDPDPSLRHQSTHAFEMALSAVSMPKQIGRFVIHGTVASGKTGRLYKAFDPVRDELVGLKVPADVDSIDRERMLRSARQWLTMQHKNIVPVFQVELDGDGHGPLIVTELIDGVPLDDLVKERMLTVDERLAIVAEICGALQYIHERGLQHREVTPRNILILRGRLTPMLLDSGIARPVAKGDDLTRTGTIVGEARYMAPEQAAGRSDQRSDLYSLGKVLLFLLTSEQPGLDAVRLLTAVRESPQIADRVRPVLLKALDPDPSRRYQSAADFEAALRALLPLELAVIPRARMVVMLHGIRTHALWQRAFYDLAPQAGLHCLSSKWVYHYFSAIRLLLFWSRNARIESFRTTYQEEFRGLSADEKDLPSIVAHSFGTYILGNALYRYPEIRFNKVILCASILPVDYPWLKIIERGQVRAVRNEHGSRDFWTRNVGYFVDGSGPSGSIGFRDADIRIVQEEFDYSHSEYLVEGHMKNKWIPFLRAPVS